MKPTALFTSYIKNEEGLVLTDEPLSKHCTFHIGGTAEVYFVPKTEKALISALTFAKLYRLPVYLLGNGSNVLIPDVGLKGITVQLAGGLNDMIYLGENCIAAGAGVPLSKLCHFALEHSLTGLEFAYGIPGSVGGAVYMNAGAYGGDMASVLLSVRSIDPQTAKITETPMSEMLFSYRDTPFMKNSQIVTAAYFRLSPGNKEDISRRMEELLLKRKTSQPLEYPSAGSTFKRPANGYAAAMIDQSGLKGLTVGGAQVSEKHAGFVINRGGATALDVKELMKKIQDAVYHRFGVTLMPEVEPPHLVLPNG